MVGVMEQGNSEREVLCGRMSLGDMHGRQIASLQNKIADAENREERELAKKYRSELRRFGKRRRYRD